MALFLLSCNHPFSPKGPFEQQLVVYSVLSSARDLQFVRVYTNYDVSGFDPFENASDRPVAGAQVTVTGARGTYVFRDTLLPRSDTSRYKTPIAAYVAGWRPEPGQTYTLVVNAANVGSTSATVTLPGQSQTFSWYPGTDILDYPDSNKKITYFEAYARISQLTKVYTFQLMIDYDVLTSAGWQKQSIEVPVYASDPSFRGVMYPSLQNAYIYASGSYEKYAYVSTLIRVSTQYGSTNLVFKRIVFRLLQLDVNWYNYYNTVRMFRDPYSIRLDEPDFTNLSRGYGLFGACTVDSLVHDYPADFKYNH